MKRWISLAVGLVFAFSLVLVGCSSNNSSSTGNNEAGETTTNAGEEKSETIKLTMGSWRTEDKAAYEKIIAAFNKENPNIEIEFKPSKNTEYNTLLNTALQSGEGPDIIQLRPYAPGMELANAGYLETLDGLNGIDVFSEQVLDAATAKDGKVYGVPLSINSAQIYYNKNIFDDLGLEEPKTWEELLAVSKTLKENDIIPFAFGSKEGWLLSLSHSILGPSFYGGNNFVESITKGEEDFTSDSFVNSIKAMDDLKEYFPENYEGLGMEDIRTLFFTEQAGMFLMGSWEIEVLRDMNPDLAFDFFPTPSATGSEPTITTWVDGSFGLNANSKHKEEAKKFLEFMTTHEFGELFSNELKRISAVPGVESKDALVTKMAQATENYSTPYMILVHFNEGNPTTKSTLESELQGMYLGELTPKDVAQELQYITKTWFKPFQ